MLGTIVYEVLIYHEFQATKDDESCEVSEERVGNETTNKSEQKRCSHKVSDHVCCCGW